MKHSRKKVLIGTIYRAAILSAVLLPLTTFAADKKIDLKITENNGTYKLKFTNSECPGESGNLGCVDVANGSKNWIVWELDATSQGEGWVLTGLQFSDTGNWGGPLRNPCIATDFNADPQTGWALNLDRQPQGKWARVWDENDCQQPYSVNYRVHAVNGNGDKADSDPVIRNGGRSGGGSD